MRPRRDRRGGSRTALVRTDGRWRVFDIARRRFSAKQYEGVSSLGELLVSRDASDMLGAINFDGEEVVPHQYLRMEIRPIGPAGFPWTRLILVLVAKEIDEPYHKEFFKLADTQWKNVFRRNLRFGTISVGNGRIPFMHRLVVDNLRACHHHAPARRQILL